METIIVVLLAAVIGLGSIFILKKADNPVEQIAEEVIEEELHLPHDSIDLSPEALEKKYS